MEFPDSLIPGRFLERPNRFITIIDCGGMHVSAHLPNTGRLAEILVAGRPVYLAPAHNPNRKTRYSLVLAELGDRLVCLDSKIPADVAFEHLTSGRFAPTAAYRSAVREVLVAGSRYDLLFREPGLPDFIVEVKGVTLVREGRALFPDAPTERGARQVEGLARAARNGVRTAVIFMVMRSDGDCLVPNDRNDPRFSQALRAARTAGLEIYALGCTVTRRCVQVDRRIEVDLSETSVVSGREA